MRRTVPVLAIIVAAVAASPALAAAESTTSSSPSSSASSPPSPSLVPLTVGARVGGYGFRRPGAVDDHGHVAWDDCRMNGLGVFARRPVGRLFAEAGADLYFAESFPMAAPAAEDGEMDRISGLFTVALGAELVRTRRFAGHVQVGTGLELTRVGMPATDGTTMTDRRALPLGFLGVGGELRLGRTSLGASLRAHVMGHFDHDAAWGAHDHAAALTSDGADLTVSPEIAAQGQFYVAYRL